MKDGMRETHRQTDRQGKERERQNGAERERERERERDGGWSYSARGVSRSCHSLAVAMASGRSRTAGHPMGDDAACVTMVTGLCPGRL